MLKRIQAYFHSNFRNDAERTAFIGLAGSVSLVLASIAVSQILLALALIAAAWIISSNRQLFYSMKGILLPLIIFCIWIIVTSLLAPNIMLALTFTKKFYLFLLIPLVPMVVRGRNATLVNMPRHGRTIQLCRLLIFVHRFLQSCWRRWRCCSSCRKHCRPPRCAARSPP